MVVLLYILYKYLYDTRVKSLNKSMIYLIWATVECKIVKFCVFYVFSTLKTTGVHGY